MSIDEFTTPPHGEDYIASLCDDMEAWQKKCCEQGDEIERLKEVAFNANLSKMAAQAANARLSSLLAATAGECAAWRNVPDLMTKSEGGCDDSTNYAVTMQCKCESCKVTLPALQATDAALLAVGTTLAELAGCE